MSGTEDKIKGKANEAIRIYRRAAKIGSGKAAKRLGEIFDKGVPGVSRDYAESLQWYEAARQLGETVEVAGLYWHFVDLVWVFIFAFFYLW